jgi:hypothetical protein
LLSFSRRSKFIDQLSALPIMRAETSVCVQRILSHTEGLPPHFFLLQGGFKFVESLSDREASRTPVDGSVGPHEIELLGKVVETTPQIADGVTGDSRDISRNRLNACEVIRHLSGLRIVLMSDFIGFGIEKDAGCKLKVSEVLFGPFNFDSNQCDPFIGRHD